MSKCDFCKSTNYRIFKSFPLNYNSPRIFASSNQKFSGDLFICDKCGLVYAAPKYSSEFLMDSYVNSGDDNFSISNSDRINSFARVLKRNSKILKLNKVRSVLDIGCASGAFLLAAKTIGFKAYGVEPSLSLRKIAKQEYNLNVLPDLNSLGSNLKLFDLITLWDVLEHVSEPSQMINDVLQYLRPSGLLLLNLPMIDTLPARLLNKFWPFYLEVHLYYFTIQTINQFLKINGFELLLKKTYWQTLSLRYLLLRQFGVDIKCLGWIKIRYYLGQRTLIYKLVSN